MTIDTIFGVDKILLHFGKFGRKLQSLYTGNIDEVDWRSERQRTRKQLLKLDDRLLKDIGATRAQAEAEAKRDFWD